MKKHCFIFKVALWMLIAVLSFSGMAEASTSLGDGKIVSSGSGTDAKAIAIGVTPVTQDDKDKVATAAAESVAIGHNVEALGSNSVAIGSDCHTSGLFGRSLAIGTTVYATALQTVSLGVDARALATNSVALGAGVNATGEYSVAVGSNNANAEGNNSSVFGVNSTASGNSALAVGYQALASGADSSALGSGASASVASGVALGANSKADRATTASGIYSSTGATSAAQTAVTNTVKGSLGIASIGSDTATRQLAGVAAGINDTDAVNVAQLKALASVTGDKSYASTNYITVNDDLTKAAGKLDEAIGKITADGNYVKASSSTNTMAANVQALDTQIGARVSGNYISTANAVTANLKALDTQIGKVAQDGNYITSAGTVAANLGLLDTAVAAVSGDVTELKKAVGDNSEYTSENVIKKTNSVIANLSALDAAQGNQQYAAVTEKGPAVNGDSTTAAIGKLNNSVGDVNAYQSTNLVAQGDSAVTAIGKLDQAIATASGDVTELKAAVGDQQYGNVTEKTPVANGDSTTVAIGKLNNAIGSVAQDGKYIKKDNTVAENLAALDANITASSGDVTELKKAVGDNSEYTSENVIKKTNSVIANLSALDAAHGNQRYAEVTEKGPAVNGDSTTAAIGKLNNSVGDVNAYQSTNLVAQGDSAVTAIGKLDENIGDLKYNAEANAGSQNGKTALAASAPKAYTGAVRDGDSVTVAIGKLNNSVGDVNGYTSANYIAQGASAVSNISALDRQMAANTNSITDLYGKQLELSTNIDKVGAGSAALAGLHPLEFSPDDKFSFAAAFGAYGSEQALAAGMFYRPSESVIYSFATTLGNNKNQYNLGVAFTFGGAKRAKKISAAQYAQMGETITALNEELAEQKAQIAELAEQLEQLKANVK